MNIIETDLDFRAMDIRSSTEQIICHHSGVTVLQNVETIHNYHKNTNGWSGIGYHFYVRKDGKVYRGRPENTVGAHCVGSNYNSIGICFEGNFDKEKMEEAQLKAGQELVAYLKKKYGISNVKKHNDFGSTDCPGKNFPIDKIKNSTSSSGSTSSSVSNSSSDLDVDGKWGTATTKRAQEVFGTTVDGIVTDQYLCYKSQNPGLISFEWLNNPSSYGSELIRAIQKKVGANVDGHIGPETIKKMQKWLGTVQDGCVSNPSDMVKAFQKWLNKQ